jgi:hypothetical protein
MIPESVFGEILSAGVPDMVAIHPLLLLLPVLEDSVAPLFVAETRSSYGARAVAALGLAAP